MNFAYIRVSTIDQNTARQEESLSRFQIDRTFTDKLSGKDVNRPQLELLMQFAREGDCIYVHSLDRLGRSLSDLLSLVSNLTAKGVSITFVKENISFSGSDTSPIAKLQFQIMGAFAEFERSIIRERQREGIAIARSNGVYTGRKRMLTGLQESEIKTRIKNGSNPSELARLYNVTRGTIYNVIKR